MRRRLRQQKRMREALLIDLGALVYELHRHSRREPELLQAKAAELTAVDQEVRALADALQADESVLALVAAGIAGSCESCGSLLSTDARYCGACGTPAVTPAIGAPARGAASGPAIRQPPAGREPIPVEIPLPVENPLSVEDPPTVEVPAQDEARAAEEPPEKEEEALEEVEPRAPWLVDREER